MKVTITESEKQKAKDIVPGNLYKNGELVFLATVLDGDTVLLRLGYENDEAMETSTYISKLDEWGEDFLQRYFGTVTLESKKNDR